LEVKEAIDTLHGGGPEDFREHCLEAAAYLLLLGDKVESVAEGRTQAERALGEGRAWERFRTLVATQGGDVAYVDEPQRLPQASLVESVPAPRSGFLAEINAQVVGETSVLLGAGREKKTDPIDHAVGIEILHNVGDWVEAGTALCVVHANQVGRQAEARQRLLEAHLWSDDPVKPLPLFYGVVE
jgi:pyrimidine-nucleoside phosphorylase